MENTTLWVAGESEPKHLPRAVPCRDHSFDESLECRCGINWWTHQDRRQACPLNARGRNRGDRGPSS